MDTFDIHKSGGVIIRDKKLLVERSFGKEFFIAPGGSIEEGETPRRALVRELQEEFAIDVKEDDLEEFGIFMLKRLVETVRLFVWMCSLLKAGRVSQDQIARLKKLAGLLRIFQKA